MRPPEIREVGGARRNGPPAAALSCIVPSTEGVSAVPYALVTGPRGFRRSEAMRELAGRLAGAGVSLGGFLQRPRGPDGSAIELVRASTGEAVPLAAPAPAQAKAGEVAACSFAFDPATFARAARWLEEDASRARVLLLDGFGKLELGGGGHRPAVVRALALGRSVCVLSVRDEHLVYALEDLALGEPVAALDAREGAGACLRFADEVARAAAALAG